MYTYTNVYLNSCILALLYTCTHVYLDSAAGVTDGAPEVLTIKQVSVRQLRETKSMMTTVMMISEIGAVHDDARLIVRVMSI